ncbi:MAG: hypothetical protein IKO19_07885 [Candidatus Riflebacteria bacterium]|nr:hypothetical protein [Candidatus Riflebacteria bacterium]
MRKLYYISFILCCLLCFVFVAETAKATDHNILPRFPEIVIEKSYSQFFKVKDCQAKASIENDIAVTSLKAVLANISDKEIASSVKFRILYPTTISKISINVNGKSFKYDPENPRYSFSLKPNEEIKFEMNANVYINYSIDAVRKAIKRKEEEEKAGVRDAKSVKQKGQDIATSFMRYFKSNDRYGKRFQIGSLISKWGLFPVDFEKINVEIKVPETFTVITSYESSWQDVKKAKKAITYKTADTENYSDAIFLPASDKEEQLKTMEILKSDYFKR